MPPVERKKKPDPEPTPPAPAPKPDIRLALGANASTVDQPTQFDKVKGLTTPMNKKPDVRLAVTVAYGAMSAEQFAEHLKKPEEAPSVRLAHGPGAQGDNVLMGRNGMPTMPDDSLPGLLVSFFYLPQFLENKHRYHYRDWVMDSGAFSAHNSGAAIDLKDYIACCKKLMIEDPTLTEIYALDVIGDWKGSLDNTEKMWAEGIPAIPCFHADEPWDALKSMAKRYPKIALGGVALAKAGKKMAWAGQCFSRVWPKKIHGFAFCSEQAVMKLPWHSVDATSWEIGPCKYGQWRAFGGQRVSVRGSKQNLRAEVEWYLELERKARARWKKEMILLESEAPTVRLVAANDAGQGGARVIARALGEEAGDPGQRLIKNPAPTIRLAEGGEGGRIEAKSQALRKTQ